MPRIKKQIVPLSDLGFPNIAICYSNSKYRYIYAEKPWQKASQFISYGHGHGVQFSVRQNMVKPVATVRKGEIITILGSELYECEKQREKNKTYSGYLKILFDSKHGWLRINEYTKERMKQAFTIVVSV